MDDVADVGGQQNEAERAEDLRPLRRDDPAHQAEHADRRDLQDEGHDSLRDLVERGNERCKGLALLACDQNAAAEQQRNDNDLEHRRIQQRLHRVRREDVLDGRHKVTFLGFIRRVLCKRQNREAALEKVRDHEADDAGNSRRRQEVHNGLPADLADLANIAHGEHAVHNGEQHQRYNDKLQKVDENVAEGLEIAGRKVRRVLRAHRRPENRTNRDTGHEADHDPYAEAELFLFFHRLFSPHKKRFRGSFPILPHPDYTMAREAAQRIFCIMLIFRELPQTFCYIFDKRADFLRFYFVTFPQFLVDVLQVIFQRQDMRTPMFSRCAHMYLHDLQSILRRFIPAEADGRLGELRRWVDEGPFDG